MRAALGTAGDVNGALNAEPRQQCRKPARIAAGVKARRPAGRRTRTGLDPKQRIAGIGNETAAGGDVENRSCCRCAGDLCVQNAPGRQPDFLDTERCHLAGKFSKLIRLDAAEGSRDTHGEPRRTQFKQANAPIRWPIELLRTKRQPIKPRSHS